MPPFGFDSKELLSQSFATDITDKEDLEETNEIFTRIKSCWYSIR